MKRQIYVPIRVSFPTLFFGILKEMIETNFSVSVWHILKQLFSAIESGGYSPHCLAAIFITIHLLLGEYLLIILSTSVSCTCILTLWSTPVFDCSFFFLS